jgi:putative copper resistance protein D
MGTAALIGAARWLQYAGAMILCGSPLFYLYSFEPGEAPAGWVSWRWPFTLIRVAAIVTFVGAVAWLIGESLSISDSAVEALSPAALWLVLSGTRFGLACAVRMALLVLMLVVPSVIRRPRALWGVQAILGAAVTMSFAWTGHGAMGSGASGVWHLGFDLLHLLAAAVWLGALLPLANLVVSSLRSRSAEEAGWTLRGLERFSSIGPLVIALLVLSGIGNSWFLIGPSHWRATYSTSYGVTLLVKIGLFGAMLMLAVRNRYWTTPRLRADLTARRDMRAAMANLRTSLLMETALGLLVVFAVSLLGTLEPPITADFKFIPGTDAYSRMPVHQVSLHFEWNDEMSFFSWVAGPGAMLSTMSLR